MRGVISSSEIHEHLEAILASEGFSGAPKLQRFLRYVVEQALNGNIDQIKESVIGFEVYQKPASYDPRLDSTVRVEASKLRQRLDQYYEAAGGQTSIRISIPKGSYVPRFEHHQPPPVLVEAPPAPTPPKRVPSTPRWWFMIAALGVFLGGAIVGWRFTSVEKAPTGQAAKMTQLTDFSSYAAEPALSRDGRFVVYTSDRDSPGVLNLWRHQIDDGTVVQLTNATHPSRAPTISTDGKQVVYRLEQEGGVLSVIPATGGVARHIPYTGRARNPRFSPREQQLVYWVAQDEQTLDRGSVYLIDLGKLGMEPARLFAEFAHASFPVWSDSGTQVIAVGTWQSRVPEKEFDAWTIPVAGGHASGAPRKTGLMPWLAAHGFYRTTAERARIQIGEWRDGWLYFAAAAGDGDNLYRIRLDEGKTVAGEPEPLTAGIGRNEGLRLSGGSRLVFANALVSHSLYSAPLVEGPARRLTHRLGVNLRASVDRAGRRAGWERRSASNQLWLEDLDTGMGREVGIGLSPSRAYLMVSPDGQRAAYQVLEGTNQAIYVESFAAGGSRRRVCDDCGAPSDWNDAGTHLLYITGARPSGIGLLEVETGRKGALLDHPSYGLHGARFLVDAKGDGWMTLYADTGLRTRQIFEAPVKNFRPAAYQDWIAVTDGAHWDLSPAWGPGGHSIFFVSHRDGQRCIWTQALDPVTRGPHGEPAPVHHFHSPGQTLMQSVNARNAEQIWVAGGRLFFSLDQTASSVWLKE